MNNLGKIFGQMVSGILALIFLISYIAGLVLAKGFWMTTFATLFVLPAWYNVVQLLMQKYGFLTCG